MAPALLSMIDFLSPLFLLGTLAVAIPLIIHLLQKQRSPEMSFSTLRFLKLSAEKTARKRRIKDLLLLLFRMAVVALLAIGLAGPLLTGTGKMFGSGSTAVAIVLDNSPSMALADGGEVRFERARRLALTVLESLQEGDEVAVLTTGGPAKQQETAYQRLENAQRLIEEADLSFSAADLPAALERARKLLESSDSKNRELFLITDMQASGWRSEIRRETADTETEDEPAVPLIVIDVHREQPLNISLESVEVKTAVPAVGMPLQILATVRNGSTGPQETQVTLSIDGQLIERSALIALSGGESRKVAFTHVPAQAGIQEGFLEIVGDDASARDNRLYFVMDTQSTVQVALVDDRQSDEPAYRSASYYLERALRPVIQGPYAIEVTRLPPELLDREPLGAYHTIICANLRPPGNQTLQVLRDYVSNGGNLLWVCGPDNDPATLVEQDDPGDLFPGRLTLVDREEATGRHWAFLDESDPLLKPLASPQSLFLSVTVDRYYKLDADERLAPRVLARLDNGDPVLVSHAIGRGFVYTLASGAHARWTTLPLRPIFLPLLNRLILHGSERAGASSAVPAGNLITYVFPDEPEPVSMELSLPGIEEPTRLTSTPANTGQEFQFSETHLGGIYRLRMVKARNPRQYAFAVNYDPAEAQPAALSPDELKTRLGKQVPLVKDEATLLNSLRHLREGTPLMDLFLILVLCGGILEVWISNRIGNQEPLEPVKTVSSADRIRDIMRRAQTFHQLE